MKTLFLAFVFLIASTSHAYVMSTSITPFQKHSDAIHTATGTSTLALPANSDRVYLLIQNQGTDSIIVNVGAAQVGSNGILIPAGGNWEALRAPLDAIYLKAVTGSQAVEILEGN